MRKFTFIVFMATLLLSLLVGCGGSSGGGGGAVVKPGPINGVWSGSATRADDAFEIAWELDGTDLSGMAKLTQGGKTYIGRALGTVDGTSLTFFVDFEGLGRLDFEGTFTSERITGTFTLNETTGTITLERRGDNSFAAVEGQYTGTWQSSMISTGGDIEINFESQSGNYAHGAFAATNGSGGLSGMFTAGVVGNELTAGFSVVEEEGIQILWSAKVDGNKLSGPYTISDVETGDLLDTGTFNVERSE